MPLSPSHAISLFSLVSLLVVMWSPKISQDMQLTRLCSKITRYTHGIWWRIRWYERCLTGPLVAFLIIHFVRWKLQIEWGRRIQNIGSKRRKQARRQDMNKKGWKRKGEENEKKMVCWLEKVLKIPALSYYYFFFLSLLRFLFFLQPCRVTLK